jgi:NADH dehydrogenase
MTYAVKPRIVIGDAGFCGLAGAQGLERAAVELTLIDRQNHHLATGANHGYFGREEWAAHAPGLKTLDDATAIRRRLLLAFERAEMASNPTVRAASP